MPDQAELARLSHVSRARLTSIVCGSSCSDADWSTPRRISVSVPTVCRIQNYSTGSPWSSCKMAGASSRFCNRSCYRRPISNLRRLGPSSATSIPPIACSPGRLGYVLSGEAVRDSGLAASGLLSRALGGPSVKPPQPASVSQEGSSNDWEPSSGADCYGLCT